jgi:hypothetical protein
MSCGPYSDEHVKEALGLLVYEWSKKMDAARTPVKKALIEAEYGPKIEWLRKTLRGEPW